MKLALVLAVVLLVARPARGDGWTPLDQRTEDVREAIDDLGKRDVEDRAVAAWRLRSWVAHVGELTRSALRRATVTDDAGRRLLEALDAAPGTLPALDVVPASLDALGAALASPPRPTDPLAEATRYLRFTDALERAPDLDATIAALGSSAPAHPWLAAVERLLARRAAAREMVGVLERLGFPDPTRHLRCVVTYIRPATEGFLDPPETVADRTDTVGGWLLARDATRIVVFSDTAATLRTLSFTLPPPLGLLPLGPMPTSVSTPGGLAECERWLVASSNDWKLESTGDPEVLLAYRPALLVRAAWALSLGRPVLACRLVRLAELDDGRDDSTQVVVEARDDLGRLRLQEGLEALAAGRPRADVVPAVAAAADVLAPACLARPSVEHDVTNEGVRLHALALSLRDALGQQAEEDRLRPPPPSWEEWSRWPPERRLECALEHLRDQAGRAWMTQTSCDPLFTEQVFPPGAPPSAHRGFGGGRGTSPADRLVELGDLAIPALIDLLGDLRPTRSVAEGPFVLPLAAAAAAALDALWREPLLRQPPAGQDPSDVYRENQATARAWLATWGTLGAWHAAEAEGEVDEHRRWLHARALLMCDPARAREVVPRVLQAIGDARERIELARAVGESRDPGFAELLRRLLVESDEELAFEGALGLLRLGDRSGLPRALELARRIGWSTRAFQVAAAGAPEEAGRLLLELTNERPGGDWDVIMGLPRAGLPRADALLAEARIVSRSGWSGAWADDLRERAGVAEMGSDAVVLATLLRVVPDLAGRPDRQVHAAVTALGLGVEPARRFEAAASGLALRPLLLDALRTGDGADAFVEAMGRAGAAAFAWAADGASAGDHERVRAAALRASLRVREVRPVPGAESIPDDVAWDPASVSPLVAAWRAKSPSADDALELTIDRAGDLRGVRVWLEMGPPRGRGITARVVAPGLEREGPVEDLDALLRDVARALERAPESPAIVDLVVSRRS